MSLKLKIARVADKFADVGGIIAYWKRSDPPNYSIVNPPSASGTAPTTHASQESRPINPIELYEGAVQEMLPILARLREDQLGHATPCRAWDVRALINHNLGVQEFMARLLSGEFADPSDLFSAQRPLPHDEPEAAFKQITDRVINTALRTGLDHIIETPFGAMPAGAFLMIPMSDLVIHKWDLAKATNQVAYIDSSLAAICIDYVGAAAQIGGEAALFSGGITLPPNSSIQNMLLAITGRIP